MSTLLFEHLFPVLPISKNLPAELKSKVSELYYKELQKDSDQDSRKAKNILQSCVFVICAINNYPYSFSSLFDDQSQLHNFMIYLKHLTTNTSLDPNTLSTSKKLIKNYAISLMNYKKIEELLEKFNLQGNFEHVIKFSQAVWLFFIIIRKEKYGSTEVLSDCGCLIISVLKYFIEHMPEGIIHSIKVPILEYLCDGFKTSISFVSNFLACTDEYINELLKGCKASSLRSCLMLAKIQNFLDYLIEIYESKIKDCELDERLIRNVVFNNELLLTPISKRTVQGVNTKNPIENWGDGNGLSMNTRLGELECPRPINLLIQTPITASMECNSWISKTLEEFNEGSIARACGECFGNIKSRAEMLKSVFLSGINSQRVIVAGAKAEEMIKLYYLALENLVKIEKNKGAEVSGILQNDKFHRALFACCTETVLYILNSNLGSFEDLLRIFEISAFDFWKNIKSFTQFNIRMPSQVKKHFIDIEEKILTKDGWDENSPIALAVSRINSESFTNELSHPSFGQFFKNVLSYSGFKITQICNSLEIDQSIQEKIWSTFKFFLSEKTENIIGRHLDQIITCSIYSVCKNEKLNEITFKKLFDCFFNLFQTNRIVFEKVKMREGENANLIIFYNKVFIELVKDFLIHKVNVVNPRISSLHPMSPLKVNTSAFQSPRGPFMTPRTKKLYAFGEHTSNAFEGINSMIHGTSRRLDFGTPVKKAKIEEEEEEGDEE